MLIARPKVIDIEWVLVKLAIHEPVYSVTKIFKCIPSLKTLFKQWYLMREWSNEKEYFPFIHEMIF
ncbi:hypothetical protein COL21_22590 [Bacillus thuringiensis]|nr:hypothetical protein IY08_12720 [Bacillus cereus]KXZ05202.1 hypothetical protein AT281_12525 [Bacillus cereus]PET56017.1 hypothetical protein CN536_26000 [Bacillus cereus]PFO37012.1 hypothetical protein COJ82_18510 [Bacillus cereus]PFV90480.1 hypothetical protein COL21_22590 [Bacillus thuringiensis]